MLFLASGEQGSGAQGSRANEAPCHRATPSAERDNLLGPQQLRSPGHDDFAGLKPLAHDDLSDLVVFNCDRL